MAVGINTLTSGAILAGFINYMGGTDEVNGMIAAIPVATGIVQLFSSMVFEKIKNRKLLVTISSLIFRFLLSTFFLIPLVFHQTISRLSTFIVLYIIVYLISSFLSPTSSNWLVDLTPVQNRGVYFAKRDAISLGFLTLLSVIMGIVLDIFADYHNVYGGFLIIGGIVLAMALFDTYFLLKIREPVENRKTIKAKMRDVILKPIMNKRYRKVIILYLLWNIGLMIGAPYFAIYLVTGLKMSYTYIMVMGILSSLIRVFVVKYWGRLADSKSWVFTTKISIAILAFGHLAWIFVDRQTVWFVYPILSILGGIAWSGVNLSLFSIQFAMAPEGARQVWIHTYPEGRI